MKNRTKTRKQGNSITLTVPSKFNIQAGVTVEPELTTEGIFYRFTDDNPIFNFDADILTDLIAEGTPTYNLVHEFKKRQQSVPQTFEKIAKETLANEAPLSKSDFEHEIGL
ncbi:toxin-antitoxin system [Lactiplantibacillus songbeiensis]|uniref:Toxin-antitoxin system n=1 Tax=Lactiplantibacillus songbeiensis TaxID=2559920 RepID=A0ABW4C1Y7_9LACO|nr:toxin-antitoxin system [Lactiplantibacillus songbeiensis]